MRYYGRIIAAGLSGAVMLIALAPSAGAQEENMAQGKAVYEHWCAPCHAPGPGHPGTQSLAIKYQDELPAVLLQRQDLDAPAIKAFVRQGILMMAPFRKTEITDAELDDLAVYMTQN